jgi:hypothetical protein
MAQANTLNPNQIYWLCPTLGIDIPFGWVQGIKNQIRLKGEGFDSIQKKV